MVRQLRRATPVGLVGLTEEPSSSGKGWSLRVQVVSWKATADIAIVWHETPADGYWEMHLGDGHPQRIMDGNVAAAMAFVAVALAAVAVSSGIRGAGGRSTPHNRAYGCDVAKLSKLQRTRPDDRGPFDREPDALGEAGPAVSGNPSRGLRRSMRPTGCRMTSA